MRNTPFPTLCLAALTAALCATVFCPLAPAQAPDSLDPLLGEAPPSAAAHAALSKPAPPPLPEAAEGPAPPLLMADGSVQLASESGWTGLTSDQGPYALVRYVVPTLPHRIDSLHTVTLTTPKPGMNYEIRVYRDFDGRRLSDLLARKTGYAAAAGTHAVRLDTPVKVASGQTICLWAKIGNGIDSVTMPLAVPPPILLPNSFFGVTAEVLYENMTTQPSGWDARGLWQFGPPQGAGGTDGGTKDPQSARSGTNVYGYNLAGDYANSMPTPEYLRTAAIDCTDADGVVLRFWRWLGVANDGDPRVQDDGDTATVEVSGNDGATWQTVWRNPGAVADTGWTQVQIDITSIAANRSKVRIRWGMGPTNASGSSCGWNIDDVQVLASYSISGMALDSASYLDVAVAPTIGGVRQWWGDGYAIYAGIEDTPLFMAGTDGGEPPSPLILKSEFDVSPGFRAVLPFGAFDQEGRFLALLNKRTVGTDGPDDYYVINRPTHVMSIGNLVKLDLPLRVYDIYNPVSLREIQLPIWGSGIPWPDHPSLPAGFTQQRRIILNDVAVGAFGNILFVVSNRYQDRKSATSYRFWWDFSLIAYDLTDPYNPTVIADVVFDRTRLLSSANGTIAQQVGHHAYWYYDFDGAGTFAHLGGSRLGGFGYILDYDARTYTPTDLLDKNVAPLSNGTTVVSVANSYGRSPRPPNGNPLSSSMFAPSSSAGPGDLVFSDVGANPPMFLSRLDAGTEIPMPANDASVVGDWMYVADAQAGVVSVNVSNPWAPAPVSAYSWAAADVKSVAAQPALGHTAVFLANVPNGIGVNFGAIWLPFLGPNLDFSGLTPASSASFASFLSPSGEEGSWTNITLRQQRRTVPLRATIGAEQAAAGSWFLFE